MTYTRILYRIYNNGSIRQYSLSDQEWKDLIGKDPIKGWVGPWYGIVIVHRPAIHGGTAWTWIAVVSNSGWQPGPEISDMEWILKMFRLSQEAI